jgi:uncharacterized protein (DUF2126 family)
MPPWLVDRTLRNILVDVTGNTHRSEFCIDKLYSPDSHRPPGPAGAARLRDAAARPHEHRAAAAAARAGGALLEGPYRAPATRWGTELHDRFLLPTFVKMDFDDVLAEMREAGYAFDDAWFAPHFEFRFPLVGEVKSAASSSRCATRWSPGM